MIELLALHTDTHLVREIGVTVCGLVVGLAAVATWRYAKQLKFASNGRRRSLKLAAWVSVSLGALALFQGAARAFLSVEDVPLDWKDWAVVPLQLNSLLLIIAALRTESSWSDRHE